MGRLKGIGYLILVVAALLVLNSIFISDHLNTVHQFNNDEKQNTTLTYYASTSVYVMWSSALLYQQTGDPQYKEQFYESQAIVLDKISYFFSDGFQYHTLGTFSPEELAIFDHFSELLTQLIVLLSADLEDSVPHPVTTLEFNQLFLEVVLELQQVHYTADEKRDQWTSGTHRNQQLLEMTLASLILLLFFAAIFMFYLTSKENKWNRYFHQLYSTIVDNVAIGLSIMDQDGHYEFMNPSCKSVLEIDGMEISGLTSEEIFTEDVSRQLSAWQRTDAVKTEGHLTLEFPAGKKHINCDRFVILDENNQPKYVDFLQDITQVEQMQARLKQQLSDIEFYAKTKDAFVANMSHELRTPVNAILGITHLLAQTDLTSQQKSYIQKIESSSEILKSLVGDVLDLSKIRAQALKLYPSEFCLTEAISTIEDMFLTEIQRKELIWQCNANFPRDLCVLGDRTRILQIIINLLSNAVKFTQKGSVTLTVLLTEETESSVSLEFSVEDTGIGISKKEISTLFQEFHQLENHLTKQHKGTGLGLCISKSLTELMGGRMWVTSIQGAGSKFSFSLSLPKGNSSVTAQPAKKAITFNFPPSTGPVLVVEDTDINREITVTLLEAAGLACQTACDGLEAVELCEDKPRDYFSLVLMDIHMPKMNGFDASKRLKNQVGITAPIVALTATSADEQTELLHEGAIDSFIMKPFKAEYLYEMIEEYLTTQKERNTQRLDPFSGKNQAIANLGGLTAIYQKHVAKFKTNYADAADQIEVLLSENPTEAKRLAHSIKGLAGTLGMNQLYEAASLLDKKIAKGSSQIPSALETFRTALEAVVTYQN